MTDTFQYGPGNSADDPSPDNRRETLKRKLLASQKSRSGRSSPTPVSVAPPDRQQPASRLSGHSDPTDFTHLEEHRQIQLLEELGASQGIASPFFRCHDGSAGPTSRISGREVINFASYNYVGLAGDPRVNQATIDAIGRYGTSVSASRIVSGERPFHAELEKSLAAIYGSDDALTFVSGHATNVSTIGMLLGPGDLIVHDALIHNSVLIGAQLSGARRMPFAHNDAKALDDLLQQQRPYFRRVLIVIEGLYSMDGDVPDLAAFIAVKQRHRAWLMVDEAHSLGVLGTHGMGLSEHCGTDSSDVDIWMGTLSKSLASCGGFIAGNAPLIDTLRHLAPGFLYSVGLPAQLAVPALTALTLLHAEPERVHRLRHISRYFLKAARALGLDTGLSQGHAVTPIVLGSSTRAAHLSQALLEDGINVQPILHPAVAERSARLRFFLNCDHRESQVDNALARVAENLPQLP